MSQNNVLLTVYFKNLPDLESDAYLSLLSKIKHGNWTLKHDILSRPSTLSEQDYYKLHSNLFKILEGHNVQYSEEVPVTTIKYDLYEHFSKEYDIDLDLQVSKSGKHTAECLDVSSVNYYNYLRTLIQDGQITSQSFSHLGADGKVGYQSVEFLNSDCCHDIKSLYPALMSQLGQLHNIDHSKSFGNEGVVADEAGDMRLTKERAMQAATTISIFNSKSYDFQK